MVYEYMQSPGGWLLWPLFVASFIATLLVIERCLFWLQLWIFKNRRLRKKLLQPHPNMTSLERHGFFGDPVVQVLWEYHCEGLAKAKVVGQKKIEETRKFLPTLSLFASISTSLGLLGTVVGVSMSFRSMALTDSQGVAMGLSTALYTTIVGLFIFLIASLFLHFFRSLSEGFQKELEAYLLELHLKGEAPSSNYNSQESAQDSRTFPYSYSLMMLILLSAVFFFSWIWASLEAYWGEKIPMIIPIIGILFGLLAVFLSIQRLMPSFLGSRLALLASSLTFLVGTYFSHFHFYQIHQLASLKKITALPFFPFSSEVISHY
ncbi:MAG: MotA/TolQ/ExbB proton channel family protein, partial [Planctomycetota bacterium]